LFPPIEINRRYPLKAPLRFLEIREKSISYLEERDEEEEDFSGGDARGTWN